MIDAGATGRQSNAMKWWYLSRNAGRAARSMANGPQLSDHPKVFGPLGTVGSASRANPVGHRSSSTQR